ncbi:hypothetical protein ASfcp2_235 [Aeromonas phage AsFcp_2]|nr:hypothetical protein ASfcp2_235 [Aeromonas phage AsFcp_2]
MADLKLGSQIGGNLIWHQGILELNPLDDSLFYKEFDMITSKGGQTINGTLSLAGDVDTKGRFTAVGNDTSWGSVAQPAFGMDKDNTAGAHWLLASRKRDGSQRAGIQVLTNDSGEMRIYTNKHANYTSFKDGQIYIQATTPSADANATRKDYVDKEINRAMTFAETTTDKLTADLATANTRINTLNAQNVKITGNQNIAGTKTFTDLPVIQDQPTADTHATNKKYVDTKVGTAVQSIGTTAPLTTTGGVNPTLAINQATRTAAGSMSAQDKVKLDDLPADALSRSGGNMKNNGFIKIEGIGGIKSLYNSKEYSILRDHNNGNVTLGGAGGDLYVGYNTTSEEYTTKNVLLYAPMKWNNTNRVLVDTDGFIPWLSIKDRVGMEGMSMMLKGPIDFDNYNLTGDYNLYLARAAGSNNPPPFDYGTMSVVGSAVIANAFVTQTATDKITGKVYIRTRNDDANKTWSKWKETLNEDSDVAYGYHNKFEVGGDANTFYPVVINLRGGVDQYSWKRYCFSRHYAAKAPDTWNNKTHRGGLTLEFQMTNDGSWGGNSHNVNVNEFSQSYTTVCGGMTLTTGSMIVWLRGGGAEYMFHSDEGIKGDIVVYLDRYIAADKVEFLTRNMEQAIAANLAEIMPRWSVRNGEVYDRNRRVLVADGSTSMIGDLKIEKEQAALILKNAAGNAADRAENYGRIRFEHATGDQHVELMHSVHDEYRAGYGLRLLKPADNKGASNAWLDVQGDVFAQNFIQTTAQSTNAASCTRKDYVDAQVAPKLNKSDVAASSDYAGLLSKIPRVGGDGVFEIARYIDFHTVGSTKDFDVRLDCYEAGKLNVVGGILQVGGGDVYHSKNKPTNTDLNLVSRAGDTMTGNLTVPKVLLSAAQGTEANSVVRKDYVDAIDAKNVAKAGDTMTGPLTISVNSASSQLLKMTNETDGWTFFQMGNPTTPTKSCHIAWKTTTDASAPNVSANALHIRAGHKVTQFAVSAESIYCNVQTYVNSGRFQINSTSHNILEFHTPGKHARLIWMDGTTGQMNIGTSNGSFTEASRIVSIGNSTMEMNGAAWSANYRHDYAGQFSTTAPFQVSYGAVAGGSDYYPLVRSRGWVTGSGYTTDVDFGVLRSGGTWGQGVIRVGSAESNSAGVQAAFYFDINGNFKAPAGVYDSGNRCYSASNPVPAGKHNHANLRARDAVIIWDGDIDRGNFTLTRPWSDFDFVCFCVLWDDYGGLTTKTFSRYDLEINQSIGVNYDISGGAGGIQWMGRFAADNRSFATSYENGRMRRVFGYNMGTVN